MHLSLANSDGFEGGPVVLGESDFALVAGCLTGVEGVVGAKVWSKGDAVLARVFVVDTSGLSGADLQAVCRRDLPEGLVPRMIVLEKSRREVERAAA